MAIQAKQLKGVAKALFTENTIANGGGLSSLLVPYKFTMPGAMAAIGVVGAANLGKSGFQQHNKAKMGRIIGGDTPARMTAAFGSGGPQAMMQASNGNYQAFSAMAEETIKGHSLMSNLETYGATPELVSALYGMGRG